jgi:hypothetical protein
MVAVIVIVIVLVIVIGGGVLAFNGLVRGRNRTKEAWSEIDSNSRADMTSFPTWSRP